MASQIGVVLCRVGAAILAVQVIRTFGYTLPGLFFSADWANTLIFIMMAAAPTAVAVLLWVYADKISGAVVKDDVRAEPVSNTDLVRIGTALIGVWFIVSGIIAGVNLEISYAMRPDLGAELQHRMEEFAAQIMGQRAAYIVQIILGLMLVAGRDRLAAAFAKARRAGVDTGEPT